LIKKVAGEQTHLMLVLEHLVLHRLFLGGILMLTLV